MRRLPKSVPPLLHNVKETYSAGYPLMRLVRLRLVGGEGGIESVGVSVGIGDCDLLRAGRHGGSYDGQCVHVFECCGGGFSANGDGRAGVETAAADGEDGSTGGWGGGGRDCADGEWDGCELDYG